MSTEGLYNRTSFFPTQANSGCQIRIAKIHYKTLIIKVVSKHKWHYENSFIYVFVQDDNCFVSRVFPCFQVQKIRQRYTFALTSFQSENAMIAFLKICFTSNSSPQNMLKIQVTFVSTYFFPKRKWNSCFAENTFCMQFMLFLLSIQKCCNRFGNFPEQLVLFKIRMPWIGWKHLKRIWSIVWY